MITEEDFVVQIVDDNPDVTEAIAFALELDTQFPVRVSNDTQEALEQLGQGEVGFVISDYKMPHFDGLQYLREVKKLVPNAYRTLLTGQAGLDNVITLVNEVGLHHYFSKPVDNQQIISVIQAAFDAQRLKEENRLIREVFQWYQSSEVLRAALENEEVLLKGRSLDLTILFTDIRNFTVYSEISEPVTLLGELNRHLELMCEAVLGHGGMVDKFIGDSVMGIFGGPLAPPDEGKENRALACAREMLRLQRGFNEARLESGADRALEIGIGIASGKATLGNIGYPKKYDFTAVGRTVNRAAKLCAKAAPGQIWMDQTTRGRLADIHRDRARLESEALLTARPQPVVADEEPEEPSGRISGFHPAYVFDLTSLDSD